VSGFKSKGLQEDHRSDKVIHALAKPRNHAELNTESMRNFIRVCSAIALPLIRVCSADYAIKPDIARFAKIKVIGIGGGGCNAINSMISVADSGRGFYRSQYDAQALLTCQSSTKFRLEIA